MRTAIDDQLRAFRDARVDITGHLGLMFGCHQRTHFSVEVFAVLDHQRLHARHQAFDQFISDIANRHRDRDRHAALTRRTVGGADQGVDSLVQIGVRHHHKMILRAAERLHALAALRRFRIDVFRDRRGPDKRQRRDVRVFDQCIHGHLVAVHNVEHAVRQTGFLQQFSNAQRRRRVTLRRLQHERVAAGERDGEHPHRHHHREIERRDPRDHAQRLTQIPVVDAAADLVGEIGLQQIRNAAGELDDFDTADHFALRVREHLAVFTRDQHGKFVVVLVQQFLELEQNASALDRRGFAPGGKSGLRGLDRRVHFLDRRQSDRTGHLAGGGIEHVLEPAAGRCSRRAADVMAQLLHRQLRLFVHCIHFVTSCSG